MAEQNRKTAEQKELRKQAEEWVESYIDFLIVTGLQDDIANEGRHILGIYQEHGEIPKSSGFSGFCTLAGRVNRMRHRELTSRMIEAMRVMSKLAPEYVEAVCVDKGMRGKTHSIAVDPLNEKSIEITCTIAWCAEKLGVSEVTYRKRVSRGYQQIESVLQSDKLAA